MATDLSTRPAGSEEDQNDRIQGHYENDVFGDLTSDEHMAKSGVPGELSGGERSLFNPNKDDEKPTNDGDKSPGRSKHVKNFFLGSKKRRNSTIAGGLAGVLVGGVSLGSLWFAGPFEVIHIAQLLMKGHFQTQQDQGDERMGKLYRYFKSGGDIGETRIGFLSSKMKTNMLADLKAAGLEPIEGSNKTFKGFTIDTANEKSPYYGMSEDEVKARLAEKGVTKGISGDAGKISVTTEGFFQKKAAFKGLVRDMGHKGINVSLRSRVLGKYYGVTWHPLKALDTKLKENTTDAYKSWKEERDQRINNGADGEGGPKVGNKEDNKSKLKEIAGSKTVKIAGGIAAAQGLACGLKSIADNIDDIRYAQVVLPLIRMGADIVSTGNQVMSNQDFDATTLNFVAKSFSGTDPDTGKQTNWNQARSVQALEGNDAGLSAPEADKGISKGIPGWLSWTQNSALGAACSQAGQWIGTGVSVGLGIISGDIVNTIVGGIASFIAAPKIIGAASSWLAGEAVDPDVTGADWGSNVDYGSALMANGAATQFGGAALSTGEVATLNSQINQEDNEDFATKSIAHRLLDPEDGRSLISKVIDNSGGVQPQNIASTISSIPMHLASLFKLPANLLFNKAHAAATPFDYGFAISGFSQADMDNPLVEDPYANANASATILDTPCTVDGQPYHPCGQDYVDLADKCFAITIQKVADESNEPLWETVPDTTNYPQGVNLYSTKAGDYPGTTTCRTGGNGLNPQDWLRIRFFIFDNGVFDGYACYQGDQTACEHDGVTQTTATPTNGGGAQFRIASFNICFVACKSNWQGRLQQSIGVIRSKQLDVVGLQEVRAEQWNGLKKALGDTYSFCPTPYPGGAFPGQNTVIWNTSKFSGTCTSIAGPHVSNGDTGRYSNAVTQVELTSTDTGQSFYVIDTHEYSGNNPGQKARFDSANAWYTYVQNLSSGGLPIFMTGDFNSKYSAVSVGNQVYENKDVNSIYCVLTQNNLLWDAYDAFQQKTGHCPSTNYSPPAGDHIFMSTGVSATSYDYTSAPAPSNGSDVHNTLFADVVIPGGGNTGSIIAASYNLLNADNHSPQSRDLGGCNAKPVPGDPTCGKTRAALQAKIILGKDGNPPIDLIGTQETSATQYKALLANLPRYQGVPSNNTDINRLTQQGNGAVSVIWNTNKLTKIAEGKTPAISNVARAKSNLGGHITSPWVELQSKSGTHVYVTSIHYPNKHYFDPRLGDAGTIKAASRLTMNWVKSIHQQDPGAVIMVMGDFNDQPSQHLAYCVYTQGGLMQNTHDMQAKEDPSKACPTNGKGFDGIDQVYVSPNPGLTATGWTLMGADPITKHASDHHPMYVTLSGVF